MRLKNQKKCLFFLLFFFIIFGIFQCSIHRIFGMSYYPDEFGYWTSAAHFLGYDWSEVTALGSYYSFGYSFILTPILKVFADSVTAYREAIAVNMLMQGICVFLLMGILVRIMPDRSEDEYILAVGCALFYPVWIFYAQVTLAEGLLFCLYVAVVFVMLLTFEKIKIGRMFLLMVLIAYLCVVHMRTIGVAVAAVVVLLCWIMKEPAYRKKILIGIGILIIVGILGLVIKMKVVDSVYARADQSTLAINDISGQFERVLAICSWEGVKRFLCGCAGKVYYLGMASFGLFYYALAYLGVQTRSLWKKIVSGQQTTMIEWGSFFLLLSFVGQFLVTAVYMHYPRRVDEVVYGRYNDYLLPVFMGIGVLTAMGTRKGNRKAWQHTAIIIGIQSLLLPIIFQTALQYGKGSIQGYFMAGLSYLLDDYQFDIQKDIYGIHLFGCLLIIIVNALIRLGKKRQIQVSVLALILILEIGLGMWLNEKYTYRFNDLIYTESWVSDYLEESRENAPITYLYEDGIVYIDTIQFNLRNRPIHVLYETEYPSFTEEGYLIVDAKSTYREELENKYYLCVESSYFALYDLERKK